MFGLAESARKLSVVRALALAAVLVLVGAPTPAAVADEVTSHDLEQARAAEQTAQASIGELEASLAELSADTQEAELDALLADQRYLQSTDDLETAKASSEQAATAAQSAEQATQEGSGALAEVVVATYQQDAGVLEALSPFLGSTSFGDLVAADTYLTMAGERRDAELQELEALQVVSKTMSDLARAKQDAQQQAVSAAEQAKSEAETAASSLRTARQEAETRRTVLITELAARRNTTVELERQRQEQAQASREQAQEEAARRAFESGASGARTGGSGAADGPGASQEPASSAPSRAAQAPAQPQAQSQPRSSRRAPAPAPQPAPAPAPAPQPAPEPAPAPSGSDLGAQAVSIARGYVGVPYVWGGASDSGVDCSGLMMLVWARLGVRLPHYSAYQYNQGTKVPVSQMRPGDMVFFSYGGTSSIYHVAMYMGDGQMIEAPVPGQSVHIVPLRYRGLMPYAVRL